MKEDRFADLSLMYSLLSRLGLSAITELKNAFCLYIKNVASLLIHDTTREKVVVKELLTMKEKVCVLIVLEYFAVSLNVHDLLCSRLSFSF
jgi:hypothetical protein